MFLGWLKKKNLFLLDWNAWYQITNLFLFRIFSAETVFFMQTMHYDLTLLANAQAQAKSLPLQAATSIGLYMNSDKTVLNKMVPSH